MKKFVTLVGALLTAATALAAVGEIQNITPTTDDGALPRAEYPRPQMQRDQWLNLNGQWTYKFDFGRTGHEQGWEASTGFDKQITVPFCPESELSGVHYTDFIPAMWYQRTIQMPASWSGKRIKLHFGAVDYYAIVYIDGKEFARHWGGTSSWECDITKALADGKEHSLVLAVEDDLRKGTQPSGKQSTHYDSYGCMYTRTTGIWQTVWMEAVSSSGIKSLYIVPDLDQKTFHITPQFYALEEGAKVRATVYDGAKKVSESTVLAAQPSKLTLPLSQVKTWSPESPFLYDIVVQVLNAKGAVIDQVKSYAGMRKVHIQGNRFYLNNKPYYLRLVLDQGFYPTGVWTAPSDEALKHDIELSMAAGFNGARLHQKVFEERFHYWADKLGYITWGEASSWGANCNNIESARNVLSEWEEIVVRDRNHPSIVVWTPFNETWERPEDRNEARNHDRLLSDIYNLTHNLDYRPVNDTSGGYHVVTDIFTVHNYEQDPAKLSELLSQRPDGSYWQLSTTRECPYEGQPYMIDEYGGIKWVVGKQFSEISWGYGDGPKSLDEFYTRLRELTNAILSKEHISGYCYTQLTDVEQEQNGIYNYDRTPKFDMSIIKKIFEKQPY